MSILLSFVSERLGRGRMAVAIAAEVSLAAAAILAYCTCAPPALLAAEGQAMAFAKNAGSAAGAGTLQPAAAPEECNQIRVREPYRVQPVTLDFGEDQSISWRRIPLGPCAHGRFHDDKQGAVACRALRRAQRRYEAPENQQAASRWSRYSPNSLGRVSLLSAMVASLAGGEAPSRGPPGRAAFLESCSAESLSALSFAPLSGPHPNGKSPTPLRMKSEGPGLHGLSGAVPPRRPVPGMREVARPHGYAGILDPFQNCFIEGSP